MGFIGLIITLLIWLGLVATFWAGAYIGSRVALRCQRPFVAFLAGLTLTPVVGTAVGVLGGHIFDQFYRSEGWMTGALNALILHLYIGPPLGLFIGLVCCGKVIERQIIRERTEANRRQSDTNLPSAV